MVHGNPEHFDLHELKIIVARSSNEGQQLVSFTTCQDVEGPGRVMTSMWLCVLYAKNFQ